MAILLAVGGLSIQAVQHYRRAVIDIYEQNYDSIRAVYEMRAAAFMMERLVGQSIYAENPFPEAQIQQEIERFEANLALQKQNIWVDHERRLTEDLDGFWKEYRRHLGHLLDEEITADDRLFYFSSVVRPKVDQIRGVAWEIAQLNLSNVAAQEELADKRTRAVIYALIFLVASGATLGGIFLFLVGRFIIHPIRSLSHSVSEIEQGNLDIVADVQTSDELGQLASGFNQMAATLRDFRRSDQAKLARIQKTTQLAVDSLRDAVALFDADYKVEVSNKAAERLFNLIPGVFAYDVNKEWLSRLIERACEENEPVYPRGFETAIQVFDEGRERFFLPNAVPIHNDEGALAGITVVMADVTLLRRLDEMKSGMVATVSHELKTPLTSIRMALYILLEKRFGELNDHQMDLLTTARADCERLFSTLENLLDLSKIQAGALQLDMETMEVSKVVEECVDPLRLRFQEEGIALIVEVDEDLPLIRGDMRLLNIVISNLLTNALKYCPAGRKVYMRARVTSDDDVMIIVTDTGLGIPSEFTERIFDKFFRMPGTKNRGVGLGLAISREIVNAHEGIILCESAVGKGTTFKVILPGVRHPQKAIN